MGGGRAREMCPPNLFFNFNLCLSRIGCSNFVPQHFCDFHLLVGAIQLNLFNVIYHGSMVFTFFALQSLSNMSARTEINFVVYT